MSAVSASSIFGDVRSSSAARAALFVVHRDSFSYLCKYLVLAKFLRHSVVIVWLMQRMSAGSASSHSEMCDLPVWREWLCSYVHGDSFGMKVSGGDFHVPSNTLSLLNSSGALLLSFGLGKG